MNNLDMAIKNAADAIKSGTPPPIAVIEKSEELITIHGTVERIFFQKDCFTIGKLSSGIKFIGNLTIKERDRVILTGYTEVDSKFGEQLRVVTFEFDMEVETGGLANLIANANKEEIKGIGIIKANRLVQEYGEEIFQKLAEEPEQAAKLIRVSVSTIQNLSKFLDQEKINLKVKTWLSSFGLTYNQISKIIEKYGNSVKTILEENPYIMIQEIDGFGFRRCDDIALKLGYLKNHPGRIQAGICYTLQCELDDGHCWMELNDLIRESGKTLILDYVPDAEYSPEELIEREIDGLCKGGGLSQIPTDNGFIVAFTEIWKFESDIEMLLKLGIEENPHHEKLQEQIGQFDTSQFTNGQKMAFQKAIEHKLLLISGGAGFGKTYLLKAIGNLYQQAGIQRLAFAAPTGKAARRIQESTGFQSGTIHRLLEYNPALENFTYNKNNPLPVDLVVIDEVSMLDIRLGWRLFQAIDFQNTAVILVGDHNQLPPVGAGNILRDCIQGNLCPTVILDECVRQAGILKENSNKILQGKMSGTALEGSPCRPWYLLNDYDDPADCAQFIEDLYLYCAQEQGWNPLTEMQILSPTKKGILGTDELNKRLQRLYQQFKYQREINPVPTNRSPEFYYGDKIIMTRNNYDLMIFNGTIGVIYDIWHDNGKTFYTVNWESNNELVLDEDQIRDCQLAYALTIHKSQGSEWQCVFVIAHSTHYFQHKSSGRNLIYTAATRARHTCFIIGDRTGPHSSVKFDGVGRRRTFLSMTGTIGGK